MFDNNAYCCVELVISANVALIKVDVIGWVNMENVQALCDNWGLLYRTVQPPLKFVVKWLLWLIIYLA